MLDTWYPILLLLLNASLILTYIPINRTLNSGFQPKTRWDDIVPFIPIFVYPYVFLYTLWIVVMYAMAYWQGLANLEQVTIATGLATGIGYTCFLLFPTYVHCIEPKGTTFTARLLQLVHRVDYQNNACPSMHVYMSVLLIAFSWTSWWWLNLAVLAGGLSIIAATVLLKRHYLLDIVGGLLVGLISVSAAHYLG